LFGLQDGEFRGSQCRIEAGLAVLFGEIVLYGSFVIGRRNNRLSEQQRVPLQCPLPHSKVLVEQFALCLQLGIIAIVFRNLGFEKALLRSDEIGGQIMLKIKAAGRELRPRGLQVAQNVPVGHPFGLGERLRRIGGEEVLFQRPDVVVVGRCRKQSDKLTGTDVLPVADTYAVEQSVVTGRKVGRSIDCRNGYGSRDGLWILDDVAAQND